VIRIFDIVIKDIHQILLDRKVFMFLLIMPIAFTFLFGYAFGSFGGGSTDDRLPVGYLTLDDSWFTRQLRDLLGKSDVIRLQDFSTAKQSEMENLVANEKLAAAMIIPDRYGANFLKGKPVKITLIASSTSPSGTTIKSAIISSIIRLDSATQTANAMEQLVGDQTPFDYIFKETLIAWENPPIRVSEIKSKAVKEQSDAGLAHTAPGFMMQFAIASLITAAQIIVNERKSHALQRLFTTSTRRIHILVGHYLSIFVIIFSQFSLLILFGQFVLKVDYFNNPPATFLVALTTAMCIAALGLLIGVFAKSEEQAVSFSIIPMFVFSGLGGAWMPLEYTSPTFQAIGHLSPIAWGMDGFKNITSRGLGFSSVLLPAAALLGYTLLLFLLAAWRFQVIQEH
jgi:ABC-2 type transport system permease protein